MNNPINEPGVIVTPGISRRGLLSSGLSMAGVVAAFGVTGIASNLLAAGPAPSGSNAPKVWYWKNTWTVWTGSIYDLLSDAQQAAAAKQAALQAWYDQKAAVTPGLWLDSGPEFTEVKKSNISDTYSGRIINAFPGIVTQNVASTAFVDGMGHKGGARVVAIKFAVLPDGTGPNGGFPPAWNVESNDGDPTLIDSLTDLFGDVPPQ
jgi:hypothetical protein